MQRHLRDRAHALRDDRYMPPASLSYTRDVSLRWVQNFSPQIIFFFRAPLSSHSQRQTHHTKQHHLSQNTSNTAQIVLISLIFRSKTPTKHKKIHQALYQYLMDFMVAQDGFEPSTCRV